MAATAPDDLYLSPDQQDLLLAALTSNSSSSPLFNSTTLSHHASHTQKHMPTSRAYNPQGSPPPHTAGLDPDFPHGTPLLGPGLDYTDWDAEFDQDGPWDYDLSADLMDDTPHPTSNDGRETETPTPAKNENEKRKEPPKGDGTEDPHETGPKRRDDKENKTAKKPGRKPLTSEPTSKRKAQNRAAQRAFRERKEKHLKDLEQKVEDLQKASESANNENSLLRAKVDRLQTELREYKRRLHASELNRPSSFVNMGGFQFDFPPFGSGILKDGLKIGPGTLMDRINSFDKQRTPSLTGSSNGINGNGSNYLNGIDSASLQNTPKLNGGRDTTSSPSASSVSQHGPGSSCGTSPEPSHDYPTSSKPAIAEGTTITTPNGDSYMCKSGSLDGETETTFCEKLGMACGNPSNPIPKVPQFSTTSDATNSSLDWLAQQSSGNTFDPVLFNDYRDPINDINSTIGMSFFDDAFPAVNFDSLGSESKKGGLIDQIDALNADDDEDEVVPADDPKQMLSCNKIWDRISSHPRFVSGELDMDGLCSELRSKAKCSEVGVVVAENDVQEVLGKVGMSHKEIM